MILAKVQFKHIRECHNETLGTTNIYTNKNVLKIKVHISKYKLKCAYNIRIKETACNKICANVFAGTATFHL